MKIDRRQKTYLTYFLIAGIVVSGITFQTYYNHKRERYAEIISDYYRRYMRREPDPAGLRHYVDWSLHRWGLERVRKEVFEKAALQGAPR